MELFFRSVKTIFQILSKLKKNPMIPLTLVGESLSQYITKMFVIY